MKICFQLILFALVFPTTARAEYRVAILIGDEVKTEAAAAKLAQLGFRCNFSPALGEKDLRRRIEDWSSRTPTNSTALIYFAGAVKLDNYDGNPAVCLMGVNGRPVAITKVFDNLSKRGGSRKNILIANSPERPELVADLPGGCAFSYRDIKAFAAEARIIGTGSTAISPPDKCIPGKRAGDEWVNFRGMVFCWCPPGKYTAGSPKSTPGRYGNEVQHEAVIRDGFWIGKYEHTRGQKLRNLSNRMIGTHKNQPVNMLHWDDGSRMVTHTLTVEEQKANRLPAGWQYSLPTEEQWEFAARAGTDTRYYFGDDLNALPLHANFADKSYYDSGDIYSNMAHRALDDGFVRLAPVGSFKPNPWGLHDVYGNVTEWCIDRGARGGGWVSVAENCRSAYRDSYSSRNEQIYLGYRFVIQKTPLPKPKTQTKK